MASDDGITWYHTYNPINLALKTGWNLVQSDVTGNASANTRTYTRKIADKDIPWTVYNFATNNGG